MKTIVIKILEQRTPGLIATAGCLVLLSAFISLKLPLGERSMLEVTASQGYIAKLVFSAVLLLAAIAIYWYENLSGPWVRRLRVVADGDVLRCTVTIDGNPTDFEIHYGDIAKLAPQARKGAVVLPANELFDEECYRHPNTALGAFVHQHFKGPDYTQFAANVSEKKAETAGQNPPIDGRFPIGTCLRLHQPAGVDVQLILTAVSTKRGDQGFHSEASYIFSAVSAVRAITAQHQIGAVVLPLLGAGKGGLRPTVALFTLLGAMTDLIARQKAFHLKKITVVIHRPEKGSRPVEWLVARRILGVATAMYS